MTDPVLQLTGVPSAQEPGQAVQTRIRLSVEAVVRQIPLTADHQHFVAHVVPVPPGTRQRVPPTKLGHITEAGTAVELRHPRRDGAANDCQITPAVQLSCGSRDRHERYQVDAPCLVSVQTFRAGERWRPISVYRCQTQTNRQRLQPWVSTTQMRHAVGFLCSNRLDLHVFPILRPAERWRPMCAVNQLGVTDHRLAAGRSSSNI